MVKNKRENSASPDPDRPSPKKKAKTTNKPTENDKDSDDVLVPRTPSPEPPNISGGRPELKEDVKERLERLKEARMAQDGGPITKDKPTPTGPDKEIKESGEPEEPEDVREPEKKVPKSKDGIRTAKKRLRRERSTLNPEETAKLTAAFPEYVDAILQNSGDTTLKNSHRLAKILKPTQLINATKPIIPAARDEQGLAAALGGSSTSGRVIVGIVKIAKSKYKKPAEEVWSFRFTDKSEPKFIVNKSHVIELTLDFDQIPTDHDQDADDFMQGFRAILLAWPWPTFPTDSEKGLKCLLTGRVLQQIGRQQFLSMPDVTPTPKAYHILVPWIDAKTGEYHEKEVYFTPQEEKATGLFVPGPPLDYMVRRDNKKDAKPLSQWDHWYRGEPIKLKGKTSEKARKATQDALRWLSAQLCGLVVSVERFEELLEGYQAQLGMFHAPRGGRLGIYGGKPLHSLYSGANQLTVVPSAFVAADITPRVQNYHYAIRINSLIAARTIPVLDTVFQLYQAGVDWRTAWIEAAITADLVNDEIREGLPTSTQCDCNNQDAQHTFHACQRCAGPTICNTRVFDSLNRRVCKPCSQIDQTTSVGLQNETRTRVKDTVRRSYQKSFVHECRHRGLDPTSTEMKLVSDAALTELLEKIPASETGDDFQDRYTGKLETMPLETAQIGSNPYGHQGRPNTPSVDRPFNFIPPGSKISHTKGNQEITTAALQFAKWRSAPGVLSEASQWMNESNKTAENRLAFDTRMRDLQRVVVKAQYHKDFNKARSEMVSGNVIPGERGRWEEHSGRIVAGNIPPISKGYIWDDETRTRIGNLAKEIYAVYNKVPHIGPDGAIFVDPGPGVPEMDWNHIAMLCKERLERMRLHCNKKWDTSDTDETIYCEIIFQYCTTDEKYQEFLGLPLAVYIWHALRLSVAHRRHGERMFTGWSPRPSKLSDRNDELNNILIETWMSNSMKHDYDEIHYPKMIAIMKSICMPKEYYDRSRTPTGIMDTSLADAEPKLIDDDYEGEEFAEVAFGEEYEEGDAGQAGLQQKGGGHTKDDHQTALQTIKMHEDVHHLRVYFLDNCSKKMKNDRRIVDILSKMATSADAADHQTFKALNEELGEILEESDDGEAAKRDARASAGEQDIVTTDPAEVDNLMNEYLSRCQDVKDNHAQMMSSHRVKTHLTQMFDAAWAGDRPGFGVANGQLSESIYGGEDDE